MKKVLSALLLVISSVSGAFATIWDVTNSGFTFLPANITITQGDTVRFTLQASHNAVEVSQTTYNANGATPLGGGFSVSFGAAGELVTGLGTGVHYYVCSNHAGSGMKGTITVNAATPPVVIPNVWINEIHYDNSGTDSLEGYEIAGPAGTNLACFEVLLYNGINGQLYNTDTLSGTIPNISCGYGMVWTGLSQDEVQNGAPDGIVLLYAPQATGCGVNNADTILQFLSYEGSFTATNGRANGLTSTDIGVSESTSTPFGSSLQLGGVGTTYAQFTWQAAQTKTYDAVNTNQYFCGAPSASYRFVPTSVTVSESAGTIVAGYVKAANVFSVSQSVDVVLKSGTGSAQDVNNYTTQTLTFAPFGVDSLAFNLTITDDALTEGTETIVFALRNATNGGSPGTDSLFTLTITDNDFAVPTVQFAATTSSVNEGTATINLAVNITNPNANATSVDIMIMGGTATNGVDFTYAPTTITFLANSSAAQNLTVTINNDAIVEGNETVQFMLNNVTNGGTIGTNDMNTLTIVDNDALQVYIYPPSLSQFENIGTVNIVAHLNNPSVNPTSVMVKKVAAGSTATAGVDFLFNDTTITWPANNVADILVPVTVVNDNVYEFDEIAKFKLESPTNGATLTDSTFTLTIQNNDALPSGDCSDLFFSEYVEGSASNKAIEIYNPTNTAVNLADYRVFKSINGGSSTAVFQLSGTLASKDVYVMVGNQSDSLLKLKADTLTGFLNFNGNDALALLHLNDTIDVIGEIGVDPGNNGWVVDTGATANYTLIRDYYTYEADNNWASAAATWDVHPIDLFDSLGFHNTAPCGTPAPVVKASVYFLDATDTIIESNTVVRVILEVDNPTGQNVTFVVDRDNGNSTATYVTDFQYTNVAENFGPGISRDTVDITVFDDALVENPEDIALTFYQLSANLQKGVDSIYRLTVLDTDQVQVSFLGAGFGYVEDASTVPVKIVINNAHGAVSAQISLAPGSATLGADFTWADTTINVAAGGIDTVQVWVTIIDDNIDEINEQINFNMTNVTGAPIVAINAFTLTIFDNDGNGISETGFDKAVSIYPNPAINTLFVNTEVDLANVFITDILGNNVAALGSMAAGSSSVDISGLSAGMYFITVKDEDRLYSKRFIKAN